MMYRTRTFSSGGSTRPHSVLLDAVLRLPLMVLVLSCLCAHTDSETSHYTWRLDGDRVMPGTAPLNNPPPTKTAEKDQEGNNETSDEAAGGGVGVGGGSGPPSALELAKMQDEMLEILLSTETAPDGTWKKTWSSSRYCSRCQRQPGTSPDATDPLSNRGLSGMVGGGGEVVRNNRGGMAVSSGVDTHTHRYSAVDEDEDDLEDDEEDEDDMDEEYALASLDHSSGEVLDCGRPVNFTYYDHLVGIQNRGDHPHIPEPEVATTFTQHYRGNHGGGIYVNGGSGGKHKSSTKGGGGGKGGGGNGDVDIDEIERALKKAKREKPKSVELYNQIGNFWRIRGDTQKSIECFRRALAVSPNNADILLNLARVLFNLQYLDDAIVLTRRSLEVQPPDQNAWAQHFQLGEILKAYCHYQEAALHLRHVLELKPNYGPALSALADMEAIPDTSVHLYTVVIIVFLVAAVLIWVLSTLDYGVEEMLGIRSGKGSGLTSKENGHHHHNTYLNGGGGQNGTAVSCSTNGHATTVNGSQGHKARHLQKPKNNKRFA